MKDRSKRPVWILLGVLLVPCVGLIGTGVFFGLKYFDFGSASGELDKAVVAYRSSGMPWESHEVVPIRPGAKDNASTELIRAFSELDVRVYKNEKKALESDLDAGKWAEAQKKLDHHGGALHWSILASRKPRLNFGRDWDYGSKLEFPENEKVKFLVRALAARAEVNAARGRDAAAISDLRAADSLARMLGQESGIISMLVSIGSARAVSDAAVRCAFHMQSRPKSLEELAKTLDDAFSWDLEFALRGEAYMAIATIRNLRYFDELKEQEEKGMKPEPIDPTLLVKHGAPEDTISRALLARVLQYWIAAKATMDRHRDDPPKMWKELSLLTEKWDERKGLSYLLNAIMTPMTGQAGVAIQRTTAERRAARELVLALSHRAENGKFPSTVPSIDPFTSKPLRVKPTAKGIKIYSVGSDLTDNGGINQADMPAGDKSKGWDVAVEFPPTKRRPK